MLGFKGLSLYISSMTHKEKNMFSPFSSVKTRFISVGGYGNKERYHDQQVSSLSNNFLIKIPNPISSLKLH